MAEDRDSGALAATAAGPAPPAHPPVGRLDADASTLQADGVADAATQHAGGVDASQPTALDTGEPTAPGSVRAGRRRLDVPGFRVLEQLGEGGMGTVYAGEQDAPRRPVAIKVLHATSEAALARFFAEAEIMARLDHPGIAKVLEAGQADGHPYFVMERVEGVTLDRHLRDHAPPLAARLRLFVALCDAIHHAHVKGVIHRDLKPSNVMVRADGRIAVLDFGIARVTAVDGSGSGATRAGELIGTPLYMSPEQARLRPDEVDARSDVYTLGVMLYELASGELPYDVRGKALPDVARAICHDPPRPLGRLGPALRGDLEAITDKALAKEPERRYQSAAALADDVRRHLEGGTVSARVPGALEQVRRFARRKPGVAAAVVAAVVGGAVFAVVVTLLWLDARAARRIAERERARVVAARDQLEERNNLLVLDRARATLAADPTAALAMLAELTERGVDPDAAWEVADEAIGRGVATAVWRGHTDEARWVEAVPGTATVVTAGYDGQVLAWTPGQAAPRVVWRGAGRAHAARPSPDGARLAIAADAGVLQVIDAAGAVVAAPTGLGADVKKLAWSPDGRWLVAGDASGAVVAWSAAAGARRLDGPTAEIEAVRFATPTAVVVGDDAGGVWRWDLAAAGPDPAPPPWSTRLDAGVLAVWGDAAQVAALDAAGVVHRWAVGPAAAPVVTPTAIAAKTGAFSDDGAVVAIAGIDGRVAEVTAAGVTVVATLPAQVRAIAVAPDGRIAGGGDDGSVAVWDPARGRRFALRGHAERVRQLALAGDVLLTADSAGEARRWDLAAIAPSVLVGDAAPIERLARSADGAALASADATGAVWWWRLADGAARRLGDHGHKVAALAVLGAGADAAVVTGSADGDVAWWRGGAVVHTRVAGAVTAVAATADGATVAIATDAGPIALYTGAGAAGARLAGHAGGTDAVAMSPDGALVASGGQDRMVRVWAVAAPQRPPVELGPAADDIRQVAFTPDGTTLVASGDDGVVRAWSVRGGAVEPSTARVLAEHHTAVLALDVTVDGAHVATVGRDHRQLVTAIAADAPAAAPVPATLPRVAVPGAYAVGRGDGTIVLRAARHRTLAELRARTSGP